MYTKKFFKIILAVVLWILSVISLGMGPKVLLSMGRQYKKNGELTFNKKYYSSAAEEPFKD